MISSNVKRVRTKLVLANLVVMAGFAAVLPLILVAVLPGAEATPLLALVPELPTGLAKVKSIPWIPSGIAMPLLIALAGLIVMFAGSAMASRQRYLLDTVQRRREDALRRAHFYRGEGRIEPTLGPQ